MVFFVNREFSYGASIDPKDMPFVPRLLDEVTAPVIKELRDMLVDPQCRMPGITESSYFLATDVVSVTPMHAEDGHLSAANVIRTKPTPPFSFTCKVRKN
jgi:hypothetical protein